LPVLSWRADGKPASLLWSSAVVWPDFSKLLRFFMAAVSIVIPEMGESVRTGVVAKWHKPAGAMVKRDEIVMDLETDKITAEITAVFQEHRGFYGSPRIHQELRALGAPRRPPSRGPADAPC
jgi:hypothetical protein